MKRIIPVLAFALLVAFASLSFAGEGKECSADKAHSATAHAAKTAKHHATAEAKAAEWAKHGWLGVETEKADNGYRITKVVADSPAAEAGFRTGDVMVAMNGIWLTADNKAAVKAEKKAMHPGSKVAYTVVRAGDQRQLAATLAPVPETVLAQWTAEVEAEAQAETTQIAEND